MRSYSALPGKAWKKIVIANVLYVNHKALVFAANLICTLAFILMMLFLTNIVGAGGNYRSFRPSNCVKNKRFDLFIFH